MSWFHKAGFSMIPKTSQSRAYSINNCSILTWQKGIQHCNNCLKTCLATFWLPYLFLCGANIIHFLHCVLDFIRLFPSFSLPTVGLLALCSPLAAKLLYLCMGHWDERIRRKKLVFISKIKGRRQVQEDGASLWMPQLLKEYKYYHQTN